MKGLYLAVVAALTLSMSHFSYAMPATCYQYQASIRHVGSHPESSLEVTITVRQADWDNQAGYTTQTVDIAGAVTVHCDGGFDLRHKTVCGWVVDEVSEPTACAE